MRRRRHTKIVATLGPASSDPEAIRDLFLKGADVFRLNLSHGEHEDHRRLVDTVRSLEREVGRGIGIVADLQGPKLRIAELADGEMELSPGDRLRLDLDEAPGDARRVPLPHPEVFAALCPGAVLLIDDGRLRLSVERCGEDHAEAVVELGGTLESRKGVNVPGVVLPLAPLTAKDRADLDFALDVGVDWIAPSFIQRPEDVSELLALVGKRASILAKLEKPAAIDRLDDILALADGVMVARGDLGVEMRPEWVPRVQKRIIRACREAGKPVVVATQMLDSMIRSPLPTRAEASDVAGAVYDAADAVMLSGETAVGAHPVAAVEIMDRIIASVEEDPHYREHLDARLPQPRPTTADAICDAMRRVAQVLPIAATVTFTSSGFTSLRAARERPEAPILSITPNLSTARRLALVWGVHCVRSADIERVADMVRDASRVAVDDGFAEPGQPVVIIAGMPFGTPGTTNLLYVAWIE